MNKLAIISSRFPYPLDKGDKLRLYYQIRDLSRSFNIVLISLVDETFDEAQKDHLLKYCDSIHTFKLSKKRSVFNTLISLVSMSALPAQCAYFYDKYVHKRIQQVLESKTPDHVYCQLIRTAMYARNFSSGSSLDLMDAFAYGAAQRKSNAPILTQWFWAREEKKIKEFESDVVSGFDNLFIISSLDRERLSYIPSNIHVINNGIDASFFHVERQDPNPEFDAVFVGNMGYYPNIKALDYIVNRILPSYKKRFETSLKINIAGPNQEKLKHLEHKNITKSGWYDNVADAYFSGKIFLAPLFEGIGQQNKILEAMALRIPCITSPDVALALGMSDNEQLLIANSEIEFCEQINRLLHDELLYNRLINTARTYVEQNYRWETPNARLASIIKNSI